MKVTVFKDNDGNQPMQITDADIANRAAGNESLLAPYIYRGREMATVNVIAAQKGFNSTYMYSPSDDHLWDSQAHFNDELDELSRLVYQRLDEMGEFDRFDSEEYA